MAKPIPRFFPNLDGELEQDAGGECVLVVDVVRAIKRRLRTERVRRDSPQSGYDLYRADGATAALEALLARLREAR